VFLSKNFKSLFQVKLHKPVVANKVEGDMLAQKKLDVREGMKQLQLVSLKCNICFAFSSQNCHQYQMSC
jgi:hypothetical protein